MDKRPDDSTTPPAPMPSLNGSHEFATVEWTLRRPSYLIAGETMASITDVRFSGQFSAPTMVPPPLFCSGAKASFFSFAYRILPDLDFTA